MYKNGRNETSAKTKSDSLITSGGLQDRLKKHNLQIQAHLNSNVILAVSYQADTQQVQLIEMPLIMDLMP